MTEMVAEAENLDRASDNENDWNWSYSDIKKDMEMLLR